MLGKYRDPGIAGQEPGEQVPLMTERSVREALSLLKWKMMKVADMSSIRRVRRVKILIRKLSLSKCERICDPHGPTRLPIRCHVYLLNGIERDAELLRHAPVGLKMRLARLRTRQV